VIISDVLIPTPDSSSAALRGLIAVPDGPGPWPGVIMVHEVFGIDENMRAHVERMCSAGYVVLMPDLYSRGGMRRCLMATFRALADGTGQAFDDVAAASAFLASRSDRTGKIGVVGFCMGGGFALQMANRGFGASAVNYGMLPKDIDTVLDGACPIVGSFGGNDKTIKGGAALLEAGLTRRGIAHDIVEYEHANHAFMNPGPAGPKLMRPFMQKVAGFRPYPDEARDAWMRIEKFFATHLS